MREKPLNYVSNLMGEPQANHIIVINDMKTEDNSDVYQVS